MCINQIDFVSFQRPKWFKFLEYLFFKTPTQCVPMLLSSEEVTFQ